MSEGAISAGPSGTSVLNEEVSVDGDEHGHDEPGYDDETGDSPSNIEHSPSDAPSLDLQWPTTALPPSMETRKHVQEKTSEFLDKQLDLAVGSMYGSRTL